MSDKEVKTGRPAKFSQALADAISERIANGDSLRTICAEESFPARSTVFKWLSQLTAFADQAQQSAEKHQQDMQKGELEVELFRESNNKQIK